MMAAVTDINPTAERLDEALILEKCTSFVDFGLWPVLANLDPIRWLRNFNESEIEHAYHLLNAFMYYSDALVQQLFAAAFQNLSVLDRQDAWRFPEAKNAWQRLCESLIVTYVTGEHPNPTDSGYSFARKARQVLRIEEARIVAPDEALRQIFVAPDRPVLFVDDFVGSGQQFLTTWTRKYSVPALGDRSFAQHAQDRQGRYFYCPAMCTAYGKRNIASHCGNAVVVSPGNLLPDENSAVHQNSVVWPDHLRLSGPQFVESASRRAGIPDNGGNVDDWRGFHKLGLTLSFSHSTPDATLPLFYWEQNGWHPLVRRS